MSSAFLLRAAQAPDALCLQVLATQVFLDTYATQGIRPALAREVLETFALPRFEAWLADGGSQLHVAEREEHLLGFAHVTLGARHDLASAAGEGEQAELLRLYVQEPFTGQGLGTALLRQAERSAHAAGARVMWLSPWVGNHRAIAFYPRRGYQDHGQTWHRWEGEAFENRLYARCLTLTTSV